MGHDTDFVLCRIEEAGESELGAQTMGTAHFGRDLGEPALKVAGLQLWVHGLESTDTKEYDWLRVTAHCGASGASVWIHGALMTLADIQRFGTECEAIYEAAASRPI